MLVNVIFIDMELMEKHTDKLRQHSIKYNICCNLGQLNSPVSFPVPYA